MLPHPARLAPDHPDFDRIIAAHDEAQAAGDAGYIDPTTGLFVMTERYLLDRGHCCENGCRHCPYFERDAR